MLSPRSADETVEGTVEITDLEGPQLTRTVFTLYVSGFDIINPVQVSAAGMESAGLKRDFGDEITFWGGLVDTQGVFVHGSAREVRDEVRRRIDDLGPDGGFVAATVHNIQANVPPSAPGGLRICSAT